MKHIAFAISGALFALSPASAQQDAVVSGGLADTAYKTECAACHIAYPAQMLPVESWDAIMSGLKDHFGEDASLGEKQVADISAYLANKAGTNVTGAIDANGKPVMRISDLRWFQREHSDEVTPARLKKAGSWANCIACHTGADKGYFEDD
jgi:mono/diheme cytochrome c family protein